MFTTISTEKETQEEQTKSLTTTALNKQSTSSYIVAPLVLQMSD